MSRTKEKEPKPDKAEKKRKRNDEAAEDVPKKSKKSKKVKDVENAAAPSEQLPLDVVEDGSKEEKRKKRKERKEKAATEDAPVEEQKPHKSKLDGSKDATEDFISFDNDTPMPNADASSENQIDDKKLKKKARNKEKEKEAKAAKAERREMRKEKKESKRAKKEEKKAKKESKKEGKKDKKDKVEKDVQEKTKDLQAADAADVPANEQEQAAIDADGDTPMENNDDEVVDGSENKGRFICFVGNLPYSATKESIAEHFAKLQPTEIRLRTYKGTEKFMGTCFIEFDRFDRMQTCLKKYHHSIFPDGKKKEGRKINVELSAGGGGNSEARKSRIQAKNDKLHDERARDREKRAELDMKKGERKDKKDAKNNTANGDAAEEADPEPDNGGIHPARLAMMQQPQRPAYRQRY